jgi:hypothetical protein
MKIKLLLTGLLFLSLSAVFAQNGIIRGNVFDKETGEPIIYGTIRLLDTKLGANTDLDGFFAIPNVAPGAYKLVASYLGYDSVLVELTLKPGEILFKNIYMAASAVELSGVDISARKEQARADVQISKLTVTTKQIKSLPSTGGEPDIAQYLPVLPGIISSGDQGGQLYIRGGSPVQNRIMLDGMTIYNPFHSIGFFSVFETEAIRSVDVLTGGFNAEHGGRISAIVDIKTREGNRKKLSGLVSSSPFQSKMLIEGPLSKFQEGKGSTSFLLTGKHSYLDQTSKVLYKYATDTSFYSFASGDTSLAGLADQIGLPFSFTDIYGKLSFIGKDGSKLHLFGFNFTDRFSFVNIADLGWTNTGGGANFTLIPPGSNILIEGVAAASDYQIALKESDGRPRSSKINTFTFQMNFTSFHTNGQINYGVDFTGFNTDFRFRNALDINFEQADYNTEIAGYVKLKQQLGNLVFEPGIRMQYFASQADMQIEPRLGVKMNLSEGFRFKFAGGTYSQNLISTVNELDIVNLFVGFLAGPERSLFKPASREPASDRLQRAIHAVAGFEIDLSKSTELNVEPYYKGFTQLISINRNKLSSADPDFETETGKAYGIDFSLRHEKKNLYLWATYSLSFVDRNDGRQTYFTVFDRRHNVNLLATYSFGRKSSWEAGARWNLGSGFPFTRTQGFYQQVNFGDLLLTDVLTGNHDLGTILSDRRNDGRLSYFHRLDVSLKKKVEFSNTSRLEATVSVTNAYNRENVFFVDRISNSRVNQLPVLPSLTVTYAF